MLHVNDNLIFLADKMYSTSLRSLLRANKLFHLRTRSFFNQTFINGQWISSETGETFKVYNPSTGVEIGAVPDCNNNDAEKAIQAAYNAFHNKWSIKTAKERSVIMKRFNDLILKNKDKLADILTTEMV